MSDCKERTEQEQAEVDKLNEQLKIEYPVQDEIWPSRRWKEDLSDYVDRSG